MLENIIDKAARVLSENRGEPYVREPLGFERMLSHALYDAGLLCPPSESVEQENALVNILAGPDMDQYLPYDPFGDGPDYIGLANALLRYGVRVGPTEITDEMVDRATADFQPSPYLNRDQNDAMRDAYRSKMRARLEAALDVTL